MSDQDDAFKWDDTGNLLTRGVKPTVVYLNPHNEIVIRQEAARYGEEDPFIHLPVAYAEQLVQRLIAVIAEAKAAAGSLD